MQTFIFDVMDGPALEFSERRAFASLEAARDHALAMAEAAPERWADVEGWLVRICDDDSFVLDEIDVEGARVPVSAPSRGRQPRVTARSRELVPS
ncbi:hypothetical protein E8L99_14070 [Phreatobacter aquaticus]|uniref:Uncharacterized protein n=1 Tax=Phreatobacter aquaticus TaxID=2570229 RepID=A0A4D7QFU7_9HYPH|nr:hypothetical protein [Phreatobacter aquaticus]QCK86800.1 hypothetical protein E8L99_14070 [Phreatobacter aquaticus]